MSALLTLRRCLRVILTCCCLLLPLASTAQVPSAFPGWAAHTSMRQVNALDRSEAKLWAATEGGIFSYETGAGTITRFTAIDGLHGVSATAIAYDERRGAVWIGYGDAVFDRLDPETGTVRTFRDIERAEQFSGASINRLVMTGDTLYIATTFGVVVFDPERGEVQDTYSRLGSLQAGTPVYDVLEAALPDGTPGLWVATENGLARAPRVGLNLQDPANWSVELPPVVPAYSLASFNDLIYVGTDEDLYRRNADGTYTRRFIAATAIRDLYATPTVLYGASQFLPFLIEADGTRHQWNADPFINPVTLLDGPDGQLWFADQQGGLIQGTFDAGTFALTQTLFPEGPYDGLFTDLLVTADGALWAGGSLRISPGFYRLGPSGTWTNYVEAFYDALQGKNDFNRLAEDPAGNVWVGSSVNGYGLAQVEADGALATIFDASNSTLSGVVGFPGVVKIGGVASDASGGLWVTNTAAANPLHYRSPDGDWQAYPPYSGEGLSPSNTAYGRVVVDDFGQKWIIVRNERDFSRVLGLLILDTNRTPTDPSDDAFRYLAEEGSAGQGLPEIEVTALAEDRDGLMWIGTSGGLAYIVNNGITARDPNSVPIWPQWADRSRGTFVLFGLQINDLAVDPANRLWVASTEGAWLLQAVEGGYELVQHFTTANAPLFSDNILSIAVDATTGEVYFATDGGMVSYQGDATAPVSTAGDLFVYPNPARLDGGTTITIDGLVEATELRVLAPHGAVVARLQTRGGKARWDGRDLNQNLVPSGIYLVIAVGENGEGTAYGKVAVIR